MSKSKLFLLLLLNTCAWAQSAQLAGPVSSSNQTLVQAAKAARKAGFHDVTTYPKQSFPVRWNDTILGVFLSLGARTPGSPYQCLHAFIPADETIVPSLIVTAGAGKLGASICDHPRAVGVLPSPANQIRIGILYANSIYLEGDRGGGTDAPPVSAAVAIDPKSRTMILDVGATAILQRAAPATLQAMRELF